MHSITYESLENDDEALSRAVVQIMQRLGLYHTDLARVLGLQCTEVAELASAGRVLQPDTPEYQRAQQFIRLYENLHRHFDGEQVAMCHWLRVRMSPSCTTPLRLMVDEGRITEIISWFDLAQGK